MRPMFGAFGKAGSDNSIAFVSKVHIFTTIFRLLHFVICMLTPILFWGNQAALDCGVKDQYGLKKRVKAVSGVRRLTKLDMKLNDALPDIKVDPETYIVTADGVNLTSPPAKTVPLSRNYFLF